MMSGPPVHYCDECSCSPCVCKVGPPESLAARLERLRAMPDCSCEAVQGDNASCLVHGPQPAPAPADGHDLAEALARARMKNRRPPPPPEPPAPPPADPCDRPPPGWTCSRPRGHEGPCPASPAPAPPLAPIPMLLWCPDCRARHIDEGEFETRPHHTHACQGCGMVWRPALVATVGVKFLPSFKNEPAPPARAAAPAPTVCGNKWKDGFGDLHVCWLKPHGRENSHNDGSCYFWG